MHSLELLLDADAGAAVRREWAALADAGLPSLARHQGETNAPHLTVLAAPRIDAVHDEALAEQARLLPLPGRFGGLSLFGSPPRGLVLVRSITVESRILDFHARIHAVAPVEGETPHTLPGAWTPHVTLASRLAPGQVAAAIDVLASAPLLDGARFDRLRRWDSDSATVTELLADG